jgi:hypothetical protein
MTEPAKPLPPSNRTPLPPLRDYQNILYMIRYVASLTQSDKLQSFQCPVGSLWQDPAYVSIRHLDTGVGSNHLCSYTALNGKATNADLILREAKLLESCTSSNLDLGGHDIDTCDLLGDGVLDLAGSSSVV